MNIALIIAGGSGQRMGQDIPKQFINVYNKPVIIYTMEAFQNHPLIDGIEVVCLEGWHQILQAYCRQFGITKLEGIVNGGETGMQSIRNGLDDMAKRHSPDDTVLVHDAIRPMVSAEIISNSIQVCERHGNAIVVVPCNEAILETDDGVSSTGQINRDRLKRTQTPQVFPLGTLLQAHEEAARIGIKDSVASCTLMSELGKKLYFSYGSEQNLKLTTVDDLLMFAALLKTKKDSWIKAGIFGEIGGGYK